MRLGWPARVLLSRLLSTSPPKLMNLRYHYRARALAEAQRLLTDYLHCTRSLPFSHAESIAYNSPFTLSDLVSQFRFPPDAVAADVKVALHRFLSYRPINEFEFFFESIGLPPSSSPAAASYRGIFLSDEPRLVASVSALVHFGFPWTKLGLLYREEPSVFSSDPDCLVARLRALEARGFHRVCVIGICLAFPSALSADAEPGGEIDLLFRDLRTVFVDFSLAGCVTEDDVDVFLQVSRRIRVFYDLGSRKGTMGELMGRNREIFITVDEAVIAEKLKYLTKLGMEEQKVGPFILGCPDLLGFDLENPSVAMPEYLNHVGFDKNEVTSLSQRYPYVMGKNKLGNLPGMMRAMDLHSWFVSRILDGNYHYLSSSFVSAAPHDTAIESGFLQGLDRVKRLKKEKSVYNKLEFLLGIGFGENKITVSMLSLISGKRDKLQDRFDHLLEMGIEYSMLCRVISGTPKLLNQRKEMLHEKVNFFCNDLGCSLSYLGAFPAFLCFDLENRAKPRYNILNWHKEHGLFKKHLASATVLASSEKRFMMYLYSVHPAAPKQWLECFSSSCDSDGNQRILCLPCPVTEASV
ncbi:hypothetical protein C4D60_Mb11t04370 [Musa balbisiana]|uniref:Transcription termination factor MTEF18, mitochondrial n=1 Tax=Musa balbisiana TaxID=52838 RepID=A0A4S8J2I2_MUSBA|nr:hypothetical protein C4D60_Mb11t04370 [Musa balbisiana]